jgi:2Fe-2S ferredoxin
LPTVHVEPAGIDVDVEEGESIMHAAERQGYRWPTVCHGQAVCTTCFFEVVAGGGHLVPPGRIEQTALETSPAKLVVQGEIRLACQARIDGDVTIRKRGVRPVS